MITFITVLHVALCVLLIFTILLQPGKEGGMGAGLGGGAASSAFGGQGGATFLSKATAAFAGLFFLTSLGLSYTGVRASVVEGDYLEDEAPIEGSPISPTPMGDANDPAREGMPAPAPRPEGASGGSGASPSE